MGMLLDVVILIVYVSSPRFSILIDDWLVECLNPDMTLIWVLLDLVVSSMIAWLNVPCFDPYLDIVRSLFIKQEIYFLLCKV
jgi:hypothetical protein